VTFFRIYQNKQIEIGHIRDPSEITDLAIFQEIPSSYFFYHSFFFAFFFLFLFLASISKERQEERGGRAINWKADAGIKDPGTALFSRNSNGSGA